MPTCAGHVLIFEVFDLHEVSGVTITIFYYTDKIFFKIGFEAVS
jgi:hypothetical protein